MRVTGGGLESSELPVALFSVTLEALDAEAPEALLALLALRDDVLLVLVALLALAPALDAVPAGMPLPADAALELASFAPVP